MSDVIETPEVANAEVAEGTPKTGTEGVDRGPGKDGTAGKETAEERKFKLKFGKDERELTERELIAQAQKGWAADERFQQASRLRKQIEDAVKDGNLDELIKQKYGKDADEWAKERLQAKLRMLTMTPEQKALYEQRQELERLKAESEKLKKAQADEQMAKIQAHYEAQYDKDLSDAIASEGLPKTRPAVKRAVDIAAKIIDMGLEPDWKLVVRQAKADLMEDMKQLFAGYKDEDLLAALGEDVPKRIGNAMQKRATVLGKAKAPKVEGKAAAKEDNRSAEPVDMDKWMKERRKKFEQE